MHLKQNIWKCPKTWHKTKFFLRYICFKSTLLLIVWTFCEGHKIWKNLSLSIRCNSVASNFKWKIFFRFCVFPESSNFSTQLDWRYFFGIVTMNHAFLLNDLCSRDHWIIIVFMLRTTDYSFTFHRFLRKHDLELLLWHAQDTLHSGKLLGKYCSWFEHVLSQLTSVHS